MCHLLLNRAGSAKTIVTEVVELHEYYNSSYTMLSWFGIDWEIQSSKDRYFETKNRFSPFKDLEKF